MISDRSNYFRKYPQLCLKNKDTFPRQVTKTYEPENTKIEITFMTIKYFCSSKDTLKKMKKRDAVFCKIYI